MAEIPIEMIVVVCVIAVILLGGLSFVLIRLALQAFSTGRAGGGGGGLSALAKRYPVSAEPQGQVFTGQSVQVDLVVWESCVKVVVTDAGLFLHEESPAASRSPVLIPWKEIERVDNCRLYQQNAAQLTVGEPMVATVTVMEPVFEAIRPHLKVSS